MSSENTLFESMSPNLIVANVNHSVDYYVRTLGFAQIASVPDGNVLMLAEDAK